MRLIAAVLAWVLKKGGLFIAVMVTLFLGYLIVQSVVPTVREAVADRDRLEQIRQDRERLEDELDELGRTAEVRRSGVIESIRFRVERQVEEGRGTVTRKKARLRRLRDDRDDVCGFVPKAISIPLPGNACKEAERAVAAADAALDTVERNVAEAEADAEVLRDPDLTNQQKIDRLGGNGSVVDREIENREAELDQRRAEETSLEATQSSVVARAVDQWARSWRWLAGLAALILLLPPALRTASYFVLMPALRRAHQPMRLTVDADHADASLRAAEARRTLTVRLTDGEVLSARSEHVRPVSGKVRSRVLYDWRSPFISYAAGLRELTQVTGGERGTAVTLAAPDDPDSYLMRIDFERHPGLVVHPRHVVGIFGTPDLQTRWRWGVRALAAGQVRYIMFAGTGGLVVQGSGDVAATRPDGESVRMDQHLVLGFDSRLAVGLDRTEAFLPYLRGRTSLAVDEFDGSHAFFWQSSTADGPRNPVGRTFDALFSAVGKVFGF